MKKLNGKHLRDAAEIFADGQAAAEADAIGERRADRAPVALARIERTREAKRYVAALSAAEVIMGVDRIRQAAAQEGRYKEAIAASKLLLDHLAPHQSDTQEATVTGAREVEERRRQKLREITQYGIRGGAIEMPSSEPKE